MALPIALSLVILVHGGATLATHSLSTKLHSKKPFPTSSGLTNEVCGRGRNLFETTI
jgi:hypothetical protein